MLIDGTRALLVGDYFTVDGELGPWAPLVAALGIDPRSLAMRVFFVGYGAAWLVALGLYLRGKVGRLLLAVFAAGALWCLVVGTLLSLAQLGVLAFEKERGWPSEDGEK